MRMLVALFVGVLAIPLAAAARPAVRSQLSLSASSTRSVYGHAIVLSGRLTGGQAAGRKIAVEALPYGQAAHRLATTTTDATGAWRMRVGPTIQTTYEATVAGAASPRVTVGVAPAIVSTTLRRDQLRVHVQAASPFARRMVQLQAQSADGTWTTIERRHLNGASTAVLAPPPRPTLVRVAMSVNQAGAGYLGATSAAFVLPAPPVSLAVSTRTVLYGHRVTLSGRVASGLAGERVAILAHPYGRPTFTLGKVATQTGGRFRLTANPTIMTLYQAQAGTTRSSLAIAVDVRPTITVHELANGRVAAHVLSAAFLDGRSVQLQLLAQNAWKTVARLRLGSTSSAVFSYALPPRSTIRVAMSINQAGDGYLGAASHALAYRSV